MEHPRIIDTRSATLELVSDALVEVRFKPDVKLDVAGMSEVVHAKRALIAGKEVDVLAVLPAEIDFDLNVLSVDHAAENGGCSGGRLALAVQSAFNERLSSLYFRYHPRVSSPGIFITEADARQWLGTDLPTPSAS
ncbi:MAG: hypothetical protein ACO1NQ_12975 [Flavobacteriales bacterium]